jgi:hypothetical protein
MRMQGDVSVVREFYCTAHSSEGLDYEIETYMIKERYKRERQRGTKQHSAWHLTSVMGGTTDKDFHG